MTVLPAVVILVLLLLPVALTGLHATLAGQSLRSRALYLLLGSLIQYALMLTLLWLTLGRLPTSIGVAGVPAGHQAERMSFSAWLSYTVFGQTVVFAASYLVLGPIVLWLLGRAMRTRPDRRAVQ